MFGKLALCSMALCVVAAPAHAEAYLVRTQQEYADVAKDLRPGDTITLANGAWKDFEIVISAQGTAEAPITLTAETPGEVLLTGQSNLRIGGEYIVVSGLVFRDGYSPTGEVISFRSGKDDLARHSRVTQVVIDHFSKPDRNETDYWVALFGQNNRFDHNHLVGKTNRGVTLAVRLDSAESRQNFHRIDHNYFGPRPVLGSNGGETLRIGTSHYAEYDSNTLVENNVFDRCDGEVEIISSKSGANIFRGNLFLRSRGALTLRHGDGSLVEHNVFLGYGKEHTGGIRVINRNQTVRENYMEGLRGTGFASALTLMNGVPNSPANRYVQVQGARIERNTIVDSRRITLGAGADEERSAAPVDSFFRSNLLSAHGDGTFVEVVDDISGIAMAGNVVISGPLHGAAEAIPHVESDLVRGENGLLYPSDPSLQEVGAPRDLEVVSLDDVGVSWYAKPAADVPFGTGADTMVEGGASALMRAIDAVGDGDTLHLAPGLYELERTIPVDRALTIAGGDGETVISFARPSLFELRDGGRLRLRNLVIDGASAPDAVGNAVIRTASMPIRGNLQIELDSVVVRNLDVNRDFDVIYFGPSTFADRVTIRDSVFQDVSGTIVSAVSERDDQGRYNVEYLDVARSAFTDMSGPVIDVYRGGRDESTFGPHVTIRQSTFDKVGSDSDPAIRLHGAQQTEIADNTFENSGAIAVTHTVGTPVSAIRSNAFVVTSGPVLVELVYPGEPRVTLEGNVFADRTGK